MSICPLRSRESSRLLSFVVVFIIRLRKPFAAKRRLERRTGARQECREGRVSGSRSSTSPSSAAASTAAASRAMRPAAALRSASAEKNDLASGTSSASTKLIHGGLRYLEYYEFRLVREALMEREVLWRDRAAHHLAAALRAAASQGPAPGLAAPARPVPLRPSRRAQAAAGRRSTLDLAPRSGRQAAEAGLFTHGFEYSDCWVDDARLVVLNARDAADRGADDPHPHRASSRAGATAASGASTVEDRAAARARPCRRALLVNAAGPWVDARAAGALGAQRRPATSGSSRAATSSCAKLYDHDRAYIFQNADGRIIFAIPYEDDFTLIGTTDRDYHGRSGQGDGISRGEIAYLCAAASEYFAEPVTPRRRRLDLFRRAPALRRRRHRRRRRRRATTC